MAQAEDYLRAPSLYLLVSSIFPRGNLTGNFPKSQSKANRCCCYICVSDRFRAADRGHATPGATALFPQPTVARGSGLSGDPPRCPGDKHLSPGSRGCGGAPGCGGGVRLVRAAASLCPSSTRLQPHLLGRQRLREGGRPRAYRIPATRSPASRRFRSFPRGTLRAPANVTSQLAPART